MSSRDAPERQAPDPPQDPAALAGVVEPPAPNQVLSGFNDSRERPRAC